MASRRWWLGTRSFDFAQYYTRGWTTLQTLWMREEVLRLRSGRHLEVAALVEVITSAAPISRSPNYPANHPDPQELAFLGHLAFFPGSSCPKPPPSHAPPHANPSTDCEGFGRCGSLFRVSSLSRHGDVPGGSGLLQPAVALRALQGPSAWGSRELKTPGGPAALPPCHHHARSRPLSHVIPSIRSNDLVARLERGRERSTRSGRHELCNQPQ
jgi:hypothetical protein